MEIKNVIKKDIQNMQTLFFKSEDGKEMYDLIEFLENLNFVVRFQVNSKKELKGLFFISETTIKEARKWPEAITIDATYKTNGNKFSLVNIVGTSNVSSVKKGNNHLQTFNVAAAFVNSEKEEVYQWVLEELRDAVWPAECNYKLPSVIVTDGETALINATETVFPECQHLLCSWHLWNIMSTKKLPQGTVDEKEYNLRKGEAKVQFDKIINSYNTKTYQEAMTMFQEIISTPGYFADKGAIAMKYLKDT